jgi:hypothetical protein
VTHLLLCADRARLTHSRLLCELGGVPAVGFRIGALAQVLLARELFGRALPERLIRDQGW